MELLGSWIHQGFFNTISHLPPRWRHEIRQSLFDRKFRQSNDPWNYSSNHYESERIEAITAVASQNRSIQSVLEVGCAQGSLLARLMHELPGASGWGIDVSPRAVAEARRQCGPGVHFSIGDATSWEPPHAFDLIVMCDVLYYIGSETRRHQLFQQLLPWLTPGGWVVLGSPSHRRYLHDCLGHTANLLAVEQSFTMQGRYCIDVYRSVASTNVIHLEPVDPIAVST